MKWTFLATIILFGCTITVRPLEKRKPYHPVHLRAPSHIKKNIAGSQVVSAEWLTEYKNMESKYGYSIPEDDKIVALKSKFRVPKAVVEHFEDMIKAK